MSTLTILLYEWKHFVRSPFKVLALVLFVIASLYGLHNGAILYQKQVVEIEKINEQITRQQREVFAYFDKGDKGPQGRPWIDVTTPFWAVWNTPVYHFKVPNPAMVYNIGQAEQYGFYKRVTFLSSPLDADMAEEIANPERLQSGTLDFSFSVLYLLPLLLLIWMYDIKGAEADAGFLPLIYTQTGTERPWLFARIGFYAALALLVVVSLFLYGALLTPVLRSANAAFWPILLMTLSYGALWLVAFTLILAYGKSSITNTLKMMGVWLFFAFIVPAAVHQWVSTQYPANLMTDYIDATREERDQLYNQPDTVIQEQLNVLFPEIVNSPVAADSTRRNLARNRSTAALANELTKKSFTEIEASNSAKNHLIQASYWFNPVTFFQNQLNRAAGVHYNDYRIYRTEVQTLIDKQLRAMILDTWQGIEVDKEKYAAYNQTLIK